MESLRTLTTDVWRSPAWRSICLTPVGLSVPFLPPTRLKAQVFPFQPLSTQAQEWPRSLKSWVTDSSVTDVRVNSILKSYSAGGSYGSAMRAYLESSEEIPAGTCFQVPAT